MPQVSSLAVETTQCIISSLSHPSWDYALCSLKFLAHSLPDEVEKCIVHEPRTLSFSPKVVQSLPPVIDLSFWSCWMNWFSFADLYSPWVHLVIQVLRLFELSSLLSIIFIMPPKRSSSKDTTERSISEAVESTPITLPFLSDTQLFMEKDSDVTWNTVKDAFSKTSYKVYLEDKQVYINVQKLGLHNIACSFLFLLCIHNQVDPTTHDPQ